MMRLPKAQIVVGVIALAALLAAGVTPARSEFGIAKFEAGTCTTDTPECKYTAPESQFYTQAAGHPPLGLTGFEVNTEKGVVPGSKKPIDSIKDVRVDIPPGLSVNPQATVATAGGSGRCTQAQFESNICPAQSEVGVDEIFAYVGVLNLEHLTLPMYDLVPPVGVPAEFGFQLVLGPVEAKIRIVGGLSWHHEAETSENSGVPSGDYHEYFTISKIPSTIPVVETRLKFTGTSGNGTFITLPSVCSTQTAYLHIDSYENSGQFKAEKTVSGEPPRAISVSGCEKVPFGPSLSLTPGPGETAADLPDGISVDLHVPQSNAPSTLNNSDVKSARVTLPEGMTLNPSAARGLQVCTSAQIAIGTDNPIGCPKASEIGTVSVETPMLPAGSLTGSVYLGGSEPITGPPFTVYVTAESPEYGVGVRLVGSAYPNETTGQLTTTFPENPELPFEDFKVKFNGGSRAPLANPLVCAAAPTSILTPYTTGTPSSVLMSSPFIPGGEGKCSTQAPFTLSQSTQDQPSTAGAFGSTSYTLNLGRSDGQQYLSQVKTVLPPGLVGEIPSVTLCGEPQASQGNCGAASQIGTATVSAGAGPEPYVLSGPVYLTGPYKGAPFGLSIPVAVVAGPFNLGMVVTRATIGVDPYTARVIATSTLPTIVGGVPVRLKNVSITVDRPSFLYNPTNCGALATETTLTSTMGAAQSLSSPFQAQNCSALQFRPSFAVSTSASASRANGASLSVRVGYPSGAQANVKSVLAQLPKQLVSRLSTLNKACPAATFDANPSSCPAGSVVGSASAVTPVLPGKLTGPAIFVSHGGAGFPDLDIVLSGDGVEAILVGSTNIAGGITTSNFASIPDVPVSNFQLKLPSGSNSALSANGNLCAQPLIMPTTITGQNGAVFKQSTRISVSGCRAHGVRILSHRVRGNRVILKLQVPSAGRLTVSGHDLVTVTRRLRRAGRVTVSMALSRGGEHALRRARRHHRHLKVRARARFTPSSGHASAASATVTFR